MSVVRESQTDPYLKLPLDGVRLIEASAGTGKTYTLATLVIRMVVERRLRIGQILAVTFTEAATQELRKRIRERLQLTLDLIDAPAADDEKPEATLTRKLLGSHRQQGDESDDALRRRLRQAMLEIDLAAIFTIHGFCARVLREHTLESAQAFDAPALLTNDRALREGLAADLWRAHAVDDASAEDIDKLWSQGHEALAVDLKVLLREPALLPPPLSSADGMGIAAAQVDLAAQGLRDAWKVDGEGFINTLLAAIGTGVMKLNIYRTEWVTDLHEWLIHFAQGEHRADSAHEKLRKLTAQELTSGVKKDHAVQVPVSPRMNLAVIAYLDALEALDAARAQRRAVLLHRIRDDARTRLVLRKRQLRVQTYDDMIDGVADALACPNGAALARNLRAQYAVALVDEFQDTDTRQWAIFDTIFGSGSDTPALFLIGDPKQSIYGFRGGDVHTYLDAARIAEAAPALAHNFRSRPSLLAAVAALYAQAGDGAFVDNRIEFREVHPGGKRSDADFLREGESAPALTVWRAPAPTGLAARGKPRKAWSAGEARTLATHACVAAIHAVLSDARGGTASINGKPVQPGDIAVLVRSHREATLIQQALAMAGIPAVAAGKQSLFATGEARDLHALLLALLHTGDDGRLRSVLSSVLIGVDAIGIDALEHCIESGDADAHRRWQQKALGWRERMLRGGPLALVGDLCAENAPRLLGLLDGERRVSNYLQLAELLQEAQANALGLHGLVDWLGQHVADADADDDTQLLRLESDARRVQIVTLHKSKGLEYPLVFLPFVGIGRNAASPGNHCIVHGETHGRRLHWKIDLPEAEWEMAKAAWQAEQRAEDARLLYVGLTRAEHALWLASGDFYMHDKTPLAAMLRDEAAATAAGIVFDADQTSTTLPRLPPESDAQVPAARSAKPLPSQDWWVHSFSQLARADAGIEMASAATLPASGGNDEPEAGEDPTVDSAFDARFSGNRYGVALHAALEHADFGAWNAWHAGDAAPNDESAVIARALRDEGYAADAIEDGIALTTQLIGQTLTVALPEGVRLSDLPTGERRPEIEFQFALQPTRVDALLQLLQAHDVVRDRHGFGLRQRLEGLMTGLVDLTYRHDGKWYVLDYKSNRLTGYDDASLQRAMAHSEYDLQALIYTLALHRWLRFRLGDAYEYGRDFGGIRYLFCRGLDASRAGSHEAGAPGIHAQRFAPELVHALDTLFGHGAAEGAAA